MKASYLILPVIASTFGNIFARQESFWNEDGDMCHKPTHISPDCSVSTELCWNLVEQDLGCKLTFTCLSKNSFTTRYETKSVFIPQGVRYASLDDDSLKELQQQQVNSKIECNPCPLPQGNYKNSCINYGVTYLPELYPDTPCLFQVDCSFEQEYCFHNFNIQCDSEHMYQHNKALFPKGLLFTHIKNNNGYIVSPTNQLAILHGGEVHSRFSKNASKLKKYGKPVPVVREKPSWDTEGDMCHKPVYIDPDCSMSTELCQNLVEQDLWCKLTFTCLSKNSFTTRYETKSVFIPQGVRYASLEDNSLKTLQQQVASKIECSPCPLPQGSYKNSCINYGVTYLPELYPDTPCLFQVDCSIPRKVCHPNDYRLCHIEHTYQYNEVLLPKGLLFTNVKNNYGHIVTPTKKLVVSQDVCYEADPLSEGHSHLPNNAANNNAVGFSLVATIGATLTLYRF